MKKNIGLRLTCFIMTIVLTGTMMQFSEIKSKAENEFLLSYEILEDGSCVINGYEGKSDSVLIPSQIDGHTVTEIAAYSFDSESHDGHIFTGELSVPDTVTEINPTAFTGNRFDTIINASSSNIFVNTIFEYINDETGKYAMYSYLNKGSYSRKLLPASKELTEETTVDEAVALFKKMALERKDGILFEVVPKKTEFIQVLNDDGYIHMKFVDEIRDISDYCVTGLTTSLEEALFAEITIDSWDGPADSDDPVRIYVEMEYYENAEEIAEADAKLNELIESFGDISDGEKVVKFIEWMKENVPEESFSDTGYERNWGGIYGCLFLDGKGFCCSTYARTIQRFCELAGINARIIGFAGDETLSSHAFNVIEIDGEWYVLDYTLVKQYDNCFLIGKRELEGFSPHHEMIDLLMREYKFSETSYFDKKGNESFEEDNSEEEVMGDNTEDVNEKKAHEEKEEIVDADLISEYGLDDKYVPDGYVDESGSPMIIEGKNLDWNVSSEKSYWYEGGIKQGTYWDPQGVLGEDPETGEATIRGREICDNNVKDDNGNGTWFWLDSCYDGAKAVGKEVWVPYIYQQEDEWDDETKHNIAFESDEGMGDCVLNAIRSKAGKWVRYDENGRMLKGWVNIEGALAGAYPDQAGNTYYYDTRTGLMAKGWVTLNGTNYYFDETTGVLVQ